MEHIQLIWSSPAPTCLNTALLIRPRCLEVQWLLNVIDSQRVSFLVKVRHTERRATLTAITEVANGKLSLDLN